MLGWAGGPEVQKRLAPEMHVLFFSSLFLQMLCSLPLVWELFIGWGGQRDRLHDIPHRRMSDYPTTTQKSIAIHLRFVLQYASNLDHSTFGAPTLRVKGNIVSTPLICIAVRLPFVLQYPCSTPPIRVAVLLGKSWWLSSPGCSPHTAMLVRCCFGQICFGLYHMFRSRYSMSLQCLGPAFGRTDFSRISIFQPPDFFRGFSRRIFSPHFCGKKCPEKFSRKIPGKILHNLYNKNPPTHFCRLAGATVQLQLRARIVGDECSQYCWGGTVSDFSQVSVRKGLLRGRRHRRKACHQKSLSPPRWPSLSTPSNVWYLGPLSCDGSSHLQKGKPATLKHRKNLRCEGLAPQNAYAEILCVFYVLLAFGQRSSFIAFMILLEKCDNTLAVCSLYLCKSMLLCSWNSLGDSAYTTNLYDIHVPFAWSKPPICMAYFSVMQRGQGPLEQSRCIGAKDKQRAFSQKRCPITFSNSVLTLYGLILGPILNFFKLRFWVLGA